MKTIIELGNAISKIKTENEQIRPYMAKVFTIRDDTAYFNPSFKNGYWDGNVCFFDKITGKFPTGLLGEVIQHLEEVKEPYEIDDQRTNRELADCLQEATEDIIIGEKTLRSYQLDSFNAVMTSKVTGVSFPRGILNISTNGGKTLCAEAIIAKVLPHIQGKFLFIVHSREIAVQVRENFERDLGIKVGFIGDGKWKPEKLTVAMISTLDSRRKRKEAKFRELADETAGIIVDECHHLSSSQYCSTLADMKSAFIRVGMTGTVDKNNKMRVTKMKGSTGEVLIKVSNNYLIENDVSAKPIVYLLTVRYPHLDKKYDFSYDDDDSVKTIVYQDIYREGIVENDYRNWLIARICNKEVKENKGQVLILVEHLMQGGFIEGMINRLYPDIRVAYIHGQKSGDERQQTLGDLVAGRIDVIISTAILDEGVDVPNINALIYARGMKAMRKILQGCGRGLRRKKDGSNLRFYDFIDKTSKKLLKHSEQRYKILKNERFEIHEVKEKEYLGITDDDLDDFYDNIDNCED